MLDKQGGLMMVLAALPGLLRAGRKAVVVVSANTGSASAAEHTAQQVGAHSSGTIGDHMDPRFRDKTGESDNATPTRHSQAYEGLRSALLSGSFEPGTRLTEADLTQRFGVSRSTMRAVLVQLAQEGYVTSEVNRGVRTRDFSVEEAMDILEARETLESALAGKAAERASDEEIRELRRTLESMADCQARGDEKGYSQGNRTFHQQVKRAAHQQTLARAHDTLLYPLVMRQYRDLSAPHPRAGSLEEHQAILLAILTRNPDAAIAAMRHHVGSARRALLLRSGRNDATPSATENDPRAASAKAVADRSADPDPAGA